MLNVERFFIGILQSRSFAVIDDGENIGCWGYEDEGKVEYIIEARGCLENISEEYFSEQSAV